MTWENTIKKDLRSRATDPKAMATRMGSGQYQPQSKPMFPSDCKVSDCAATQCLHNKNNKCTLSSVTIKPDGTCGKFAKKGTIER